MIRHHKRRPACCVDLYATAEKAAHMNTMEVDSAHTSMSEPDDYEHVEQDAH